MKKAGLLSRMPKRAGEMALLAGCCHAGVETKSGAPAPM